MTHRAVLSACFGLALSLPAAAHAQLDFEELPRGHLRPSPDGAPWRISRSQRTEGLHPHRERLGGEDPRLVVRVLPSRWLTDRPGPPLPLFARSQAKQDRACVTARSATEPHSVRNPWQLHFGWTDTVQFDPRMQKGRDAVFAVHVERLVEDGGGEYGPALEVTDAWLDVRSLGVREVARYQLPLREVAQGPAGLRIYAARDGERVHFVVRPPDPPEGPDHEGLLDRTRALHVIAGVQPISSAHCGHMRLTLTAEVAGGETAVVRATMASAGGPEEEEARGRSSPSSASAASEAAGILGLIAQNSGAPAAEVLLRPLNIQLSVSRTSSDEAPRPSVSLGWAGPATRVQL